METQTLGDWLENKIIVSRLAKFAYFSYQAISWLRVLALKDIA